LIVARRLLICALAAAALAAVGAAPAHARRTYCARDGDYCLGMFKRGGQIFLGIDTFAFRGSVRLCVQSPDGKRRCLIFKLRRDPHNGHLYRSHVKWSDHFPHGQKGLYRAAWHYAGTRLPLIHFTVR
jgi:hypothetical protein